MARKSRDLRISQTKSLIKEYEKEGLFADYRYRFISDALSRLERSRSLSTRQRSWLDSLIEEGVPQIKRDEDLIKKIKDAIDLRGMGHRKSTLTDFLNKVSAGRDLTAKQSAFLNGMIKEAESIRASGPYVPEESIAIKLRQCIQFAKSYSSMYWQTHPGTYRALKNVEEWLESIDSESDEEFFIDEWSVNKLCKAMSSKLREINEKPYVSPGDLVWCRMGYRREPVTGIVSGVAEISQSGEIVYPILREGKLDLVGSKSLTKRKPSGEKLEI